MIFEEMHHIYYKELLQKKLWEYLLSLSGFQIEPDIDGNMASTLFYVQFGVEWIEPTPGNPTLPIPTIPDVVEWTSDVNKVYILLKITYLI